MGSVSAWTRPLTTQSKKVSVRGCAWGTGSPPTPRRPSAQLRPHHTRQAGRKPRGPSTRHWRHLGHMGGGTPTLAPSGLLPTLGIGPQRLEEGRGNEVERDGVASTPGQPLCTHCLAAPQVTCSQMGLLGAGRAIWSGECHPVTPVTSAPERKVPQGLGDASLLHLLLGSHPGVPKRLSWT